MVASVAGLVLVECYSTCSASGFVLLLALPGVFNIRRLLQLVVPRFTSPRVMPLFVAVLVIAVAVPMAASRSTRSAAVDYDSIVGADRPAARAARPGVSSDEALLRVDQRSVFAGAQDASARSLEFWARPQSVRRHGQVRRGRLSLGWGSTRVRFRSTLPVRRATHVVVEWSDDAIGLYFDGNQVEAASLGAPSETARAHRVALLGAAPQLDLREVALYRDGLRIGQIRRHHRTGTELFGQHAANAPAAASGAIAHAAAVPGNTALPTISGTAKDGQTLTATTGTWSGSPTSYARAWQRCDTAGANCVAISGATATTYLLTSTDVGKTIRVKVTATNATGSSNATSAATATVTAAAPVNTAVPSTTGMAKDGQTLTSTTGTWTGTTPLTYARQWRRCDSAGANCADISGATATTYVLVAADVSKTIRVVLTASNTAGNAAATSAATATVTAAAPANTALPAITGTAKEGQQLSASTGTWAGSATITYAYQWQTCNASGAACTAISGATLSSYRLTSTDVGKTVKAVVTATNAIGSASATSAATAAITTGPPVSTTAPTVTGTAKDGQTLTSTNGTWAGTVTITYARQWKRCNSAGASCTNISGATGTTYTLVAADVGFTVKTTWTATNSLGSASADTPLSAVVTATAPVNTALPAITGTAKDGQTLTSTTGTWTGSATITYTRQWKRCDSAGANCTNISGATGTTYVLGGSDVGSTVKVTITATNSAGSASADAPATAVVTGQTPTNTALPTITGTAKDGQTLTSTTGTWTGSATITYTRQWRQCDGAGSNCVDIQGATQATYVLTGNEAGRRIRVVVTATNSLGSTSATSAATSSVTRLAPTNTTAPTFASQISGAGAKEGLGQDVQVGTWSGTAPLTYTYQWQRCDAAGANCVDVSTNGIYSTYWPAPDDVGSTLRVNVTARNSAGSATASSAVSEVVSHTKPILEDTNHVNPQSGGWTPPGNKLPETPFAFSTMGQRLTWWQGSDPITNTWQWMHCDEHGDDCYDIPGATERDHDLSYMDGIGYTLRVRTVGTNAYGSTVDVSPPSKVVSSPAPINVNPATIAGNTRNHLELSVNPGTWNDLYWNLRSTTYEWWRCPASITDPDDVNSEVCPPIPDDANSGVNNETYQLTDDDVGHRLVAMETAETEGGFRAGRVSELSAIVTDASTPPAVTLGGSLVADPNAWLDGDSYDLSVSAVAGADTSGLTSVAVMYDGEQLAQLDGCAGASCVVSGDVDVDLSLKDDGVSPLIVVATDADHTETVERRDVHIDRGAPRPPQHVLTDISPDGSTMVTWEPSNSPDAASYEILRRSSSDEPFTVVGTTEDDFFVDPSSGASAPLARMTAARFAVATEAQADDGHAEYQVRTADQAGEVSDPTPIVKADATETPTPAPTELQVDQLSAAAPTELTWDAAPGADGYAVFRSLDVEAGLASPATGQSHGTPELIADVPAEVTDLADTPEVSGRYTYTVRSVNGGQLGDTSPETGVDLQATKIPISEDALSHAPAITAALEAAGAPARPRMACDATCEKLHAAAIALPRAGSTADAIAEQAYKLGARIKALPEADVLTGAAARATLAGTAFLAGWEIGTHIRKSYLTLEDVPLPTAEIANWKLAYGHGIARHWTCGYNWEGTACIGNGIFYLEGNIRTPGFGAVALDASNRPIGIDSWTTACSSPEQPDPQAVMPGGWRWLMQVGPCPYMWGQSAFRWVPYHHGRLGPPMAGTDGASVGNTTPVPPVQPGEHAPTEAEAVQILLDQLRDHADEYSALIPWLERELGLTPTATSDGTPFCGGKTYEACVSAFQHAGFAGPFTKKVLNPDEAWIDAPGGAVITTTPRADDVPDGTDGEVVIEANPDVMPEMTAADEAVDEELEAENPESENKNLTREIRRNLARRCRIYIGKTSLSINLCSSLPIMITGGADAMGPARNDALALKRHARWLGLNSRLPAPQRARPPWYQDLALPEPGCVRSESQPGVKRAPAGMGCDEYPMWGMSQGHTGDLETETPNLMWVPARENGRQGNVFNHFASGGGVDSMLFRGCSISSEPPKPGLTALEKDAELPTFLAIPLPFDMVPSFGICNRLA
jgi:hypothetical protein